MACEPRERAAARRERILSPLDLSHTDHVGRHRAFARHGRQSLFRAFAQVAWFPAFPNAPRESSHVSRREAHAAGAHREGTMSCLGHVGHMPQPFTRTPKLISKMIPGPSCGRNSGSNAAGSRVLEFTGNVNSAVRAHLKCAQTTASSNVHIRSDRASKKGPSGREQFDGRGSDQLLLLPRCRGPPCCG